MSAETFCGQSCQTCSKKEAMNCPGCSQGPGKMIGCECELAKCCRSKGHKTCETCTSHFGCGKYLRRHTLAEERQKRRQAEHERKMALAEKAAIMSEFYKRLFWLFVPSTIGSLLANELVQGWSTTLYYIGVVLSHGTNILYAILLFGMASYEERYRKAGIYGLVVSGINLLIAFAGAETGDLSLLLSIPLAVLGLLYTYNEYTAHSEFFDQLELGLSDSWRALWKAYIVLICVTIGGAFLVIISAGLALVAVVIGAIGLVVVSIIKLVQLWHSAKETAFYALLLEEKE